MCLLIGRSGKRKQNRNKNSKKFLRSQFYFVCRFVLTASYPISALAASCCSGGICHVILLSVSVIG